MVPITAYAVACPAGALLGVTEAAPAMGVATLRTTITLTSAAIPNERTRSRGCRDPIGIRSHVYQSSGKGQARVDVNDRPPESAIDVLSIPGPELPRLLLLQRDVIHTRLHERRGTDFMRFTGVRLHPSSIAPELPEMNRLSAVDRQRFKIGPLPQSHPRITLRSLNVSGDELDAPHLDVCQASARTLPVRRASDVASLEGHADRD